MASFLIGIEPMNIFELLTRLWSELSKKRRKQAVATLFIVTVSSLSELFTLFTLVPFLTALSAPQKLMEIRGMQSLAEFLNANEPQSLVLPLALLLSMAALFGAFLRFCALFSSSWIAARIGNDLSVGAFGDVLHADFSFHAINNSSMVMSVLGTVDELVILFLRPLFQVISSISITLVVVFGLLVINPGIVIVLGVLTASFYFAIARLSESRIREINHSVSSLREVLLRNQQESLSGIREMIITKSQFYAIQIHKRTDQKLRDYNSKAYILAVAPRFFVEGIGITLIAFSALFLFAIQGAATAIPTIGVLSLATQRLLPSIQDAYGSFTIVRSHKNSLSSILEIIKQAEASKRQTRKTGDLIVKNGEIESQKSISKITFNNLFFAYDDKRIVFRGINGSINRGDKLAIIGPSGSGKSTLIDLLIGFYLPTKGSVDLDGIPMVDECNDRRCVWHSMISYVPQFVHLVDATILQNIILGTGATKYDNDKLITACKMAQAYEFINSLPAGLHTKVGERGVNLSGGQKQRIGIARALYQSKPVLILDEPTNSLDAESAEKIIDSLMTLPDSITVIFVTHGSVVARKAKKILQLVPESNSISIQG